VLKKYSENVSLIGIREINRSNEIITVKNSDVKIIDFLSFSSFVSALHRIIAVLILKEKTLTIICPVISNIASIPYSEGIKAPVYRGKSIKPISFDEILPNP
jgi:hypothetical protein